MRLDATRVRDLLLASFRRLLLLLIGSLVLPSAGVLLACLVDGKIIERITLRGSEVRQILQAERWISNSQAWRSPSVLDEADDAVTSAEHTWKSIALPDALSEDLTTSSPLSDQTVEPPEPPQVVWYRINPGKGERPEEGSIHQLYLPRIFVAGTAAVYVGGRLVWRQRNAQVLTPYYEPILLDLDAEGSSSSDRLSPIYIRLAARARDGWALSAPWVAPSGMLINAYQLRTLLQGGVVISSWVAYWVAGALAFAMWLWRRRKTDEPVYFWFCLLALTVPTLLLPYIVSPFIQQYIGVSLWFALTGPLIAFTCMMRFYRFAFGYRQKVLEGLSVVSAAIIMVVMTFRIVVGVGRERYVELAGQLVQLINIPFLLQSVYVAFFVFSVRTRLAYFMGLTQLVLVFALVHDTQLASHRGHIDDLVYLTFCFSLSLTIYIAIAARNYASSVRAAEHAQLNLQDALSAKEAELVESHKRLLLIQHEQTLSHERQRMMQEMHDGIGASLISALRYLKHGEKDRAAVTQVLEECIDDLKISIDSLEPAGGDLLLLLSSLRFRLGPRLQGSGISLSWQVAELPRLLWLDARYGMHVLRILQEILTNLLKHSSADMLLFSTAVVARENNPGVTICVADNGRSFVPPPSSEIPAARKGIGNVLSRTRQLGGACQWQTLAEGNQFTLWLPISRD
jgi:signal transduction histidine kinase